MFTSGQVEVLATDGTQAFAARFADGRDGGFNHQVLARQILEVDVGIVA